MLFICQPIAFSIDYFEFVDWNNELLWLVRVRLVVRFVLLALVLVIYRYWTQFWTYMTRNKMKNSNRKRNWEKEKDSLMNLHRWTTIKQQQILNWNRICWNQVKHFWLFIYLLMLLFFRCCCISVGFKMNWLKNKPNAIIDSYQLKNENGINFVTLEIKRKRLILKQRKKWTKMHIGRHIFLAFSVDSDWLTG